MSKTKIACVQMDVAIGDVETNQQKISQRIHDAAEQGAQLVIFPECALTGYCFDSLDEAAPFAQPLDGPATETIANACRETDLFAVVGLIEREGSNFYNAALIAGPNGIISS